MSLFLWVFVVSVAFRNQFRDADVPCGNDVEDVLALEMEELVDNPGTMIGTWFPCCFRFSCLFG